MHMHWSHQYWWEFVIFVFQVRLRCRPRFWLTALKWIHQWVCWPAFTFLRCHTQPTAGRPPFCCITAKTTRRPTPLTSSLCVSPESQNTRVSKHTLSDQIYSVVFSHMLVDLFMSSVCVLGLMYVTHYMDNNLTNPFKLWDSMGRPDYPTTQQFTLLRSQEVQHTHTDFKGFILNPWGIMFMLKSRRIHEQPDRYRFILMDLWH